LSTEVKAPMVGKILSVKVEVGQTVSEDDEMVYVYLMPSKEYEYLEGIVVIVIDDDEAVFVNIVGEIHPDDVDNLGEFLDIDELDLGHSKGKHRNRN